jgi:hypothetical protein
VYPPDLWEEIPPGANRQLDPEEGIHLPGELEGRALDAQWNPLRHRNQLRRTALPTGKNPCSNSDLPQEAEGETDHLPEIP